MPQDLGKITVLVHGFAVTEDQVEETFFPTYLKRLYWVGHPVLSSQVDTAGLGVGVVGFTWPGDLVQTVLIPDGVERALFYPEDEFHALQTGIPFAGVLAELRNQNPNARIDVIAHSLGNLVVNSALMQPGMDDVVSTYVMNEAALAAEAFADEYAYAANEARVLHGHATNHGYSKVDQDADNLWELEYERLQPNELAQWEALVSQDTHLFPKPNYETRWGQKDRPTELPPTEDVDPPRRGPWRGFFKGNVARVGRLVNTHNHFDQIIGLPDLSIEEAWPLTVLDVADGGLRTPLLTFTGLKFHAWYLTQRMQKPRTGSLADIEPFTRKDSPKRMLWARLGVDTRDEEYLWNGGGNHSNLTRQWAELAYWFPALSRTAGSDGMAISGIEDVDFSDIGAGGSVLPAADALVNHSYMILKTLPEVWTGYTRLHARLSQ